MAQVITFDKSLQMRLQEYDDVLSGYETLPVSALQKEWSFYLDLMLDPNGWQALWKIQRTTCEDLGIPFPSIVLVVVLNLDLPNLQALVRVLAVQDDIHIADRHFVPLKQLFPTKGQDESVVLNIEQTANCLDMLRFFYNHLFMVWDLEEDDCLDWKSKHLETRLRLYYDAKNQIIPRATAEHLHSLLGEAKRLDAKRKKLESLVTDIEDENNETVDELMELHIRLKEIQSEVEIIENPLLRRVHMKRYQVSPNATEKSNNIWLVYDQGKITDCIDFLSEVQKEFPEKTVRFAPCLSTTLVSANRNDVYILSPSNHAIQSTGALEEGGVLKGIYDNKSTVLTSTREDVMLDFKGTSTILENLTINASSAQCAIIVRGGQLKLKNCKMFGDGKSSTHQGIIVLAGAQLEIENCEIANFFTAIVGNTGGKIVIKSSEISDVCVGMRIYHNCAMNMEKSLIRKCKDYGVCVETDKSFDGDDDTKVGSFETLNIVPQVQIDSVEGSENAKGDAIINKKPALEPFDDLFVPGLDITLCNGMEVEQEEGSEEPDGRVSPATI